MDEPMTTHTVKPSIVGFVDGTVVHGPDAATLAQWVVAVHDAGCHECGSPRSDSRCPQGQRYADAARPDLSWIPSPRTGA